MNSSKYFDWAATAPADETIWKEALDTAIANSGNPSAVHTEGQKARTAFENARKEAALSLGVKPEEVFFTSGGTESDHLPLLSLLNRECGSDGHRGRIILSGIEHPALREQAAALKKHGFDVVTVNPDSNGFISAQSIIDKVTPDTLYVTVMAVNNETGCIQPVYEIADQLTKAAAGKRKPFFHVDCVQAAGKVPLDLSYPGIDSAALSAHKICGPRGIGILVLKKEIKGFLVGGGQEKNIRSGTENLFGAVAFGKCLSRYYLKEKAASDAKAPLAKTAGASSEQFAHLKEQIASTQNFIDELKTIPVCTIVPQIREDLSQEIQEQFSPYVLQAAFKGIPGNVMVRALDAKGFCISTGSACSAKKQSRPILAAMNASRDIQDTAVRFSFGPSTTKKDMEELFTAVKDVCSDFC